MTIFFFLLCQNMERLKELTRIGRARKGAEDAKG